MSEIVLRYGINPHQLSARVVSNGERLPFSIINGSCSYINLLDALNAWQLVRELRYALNLPAAASFKHVSPAGAAVFVAMSPAVTDAYHLSNIDLSELSVAYARARGADRVSSFGDFVALSDIVDAPTARLLRREISDGVIAPGYDSAALEILRSKQNGRYIIIEMDPDYRPPQMEFRDVYGIRLEQQRNDRHLTPSDFSQVVTNNKSLSETAKRDLTVASITLKYTQSNSVCLALDGQVIGVGAGQQSRVHCTRLASQKADTWYLRQHPLVLNLKFRDKITRTEMDNSIDQYIRDEFTVEERAIWRQAFQEAPPSLDEAEKKRWLAGLSGVALASDGFIPFRDNIDRAVRSGVAYIAQPGGSNRDQEVIQACDTYNIVMAFTGLRLFHH